MKFKYCTVICCILSFTGAIAEDNEPLVQLISGQLRGTYLSIPNHEKQAVSFLGVPYAAPPVGDFRFQPPQPLESWEGIKDASQYGAPCPQMLKFAKVGLKDVMGIVLEEPKPPSEDCLTLDIYSPSLTGKHPVMVFIHGGGLNSGWSAIYEFRSYAIVEDIVAVSIQYRLGAFGWLSTGDGLVEGNMGFKDQVAALKWVKDNIALFGGDPDQVTIFGESAGGWSVSMHILSPASSGLFHRAIVQSGAVVDSLVFDPPIPLKATAIGLADNLGCPMGNMVNLVECLREQPADLLADPSPSEHFDGENLSLNYAPTLDRDIFPELPADLLRKGTFNTNVDIIVGLSNVEGYLIGSFLNPRLAEPDFSMTDFRIAVLSDTVARYPDSPPEVIDALVDSTLRIYSGAPQGDRLYLDYSDWFGDGLLGVSTFKLAVGVAGKGKGQTYFYEMRYRPSLSKRPDYIISDHADDLYFIHGAQYTGNVLGQDVTFTDDDNQMAHVMMKYWTNFGRSGNPNGENLPHWPQFFGSTGSYMVLQPQPVVEHNYKACKMDFWLQTAPAILAKAKAKAASIPGEGPIVDTKKGKLKGKVVTLTEGDKSGFAFFNIPYAAPPEGELRFQPPQPVTAWVGIRDATKPGLPCSQMKAFQAQQFHGELDINMKELKVTSEDCLHLNVYTSNLTGKRPVMVFIHGGGFMVGWASTYDMRVYAILHDIVGVVFQYRLGVLGLLNTGDGVVSGNQLFKDQVAALQWVQENIAQFGGDPDQVTIFGESAGSVSVSMHLASPVSKGLFHRAILQSGSIYESFSFSPPIQPAGEVMKLANILGCPNTSSEVIVECLKKKPADQLMDPVGLGTVDPTNMLNWVPTVEDGLIPDLPTNIFNSGNFNTDVDVIAGITKVEGYMMGKMFAPGFNQPGIGVAYFQAIVGGILGTIFPGNERMAEMVAAATKAYVKDRNNGDEISLAVAEFVGDFLISNGAVKTALKISEKNKQNVYMYEFSKRPALSIRPDYIIADHGDDLLFTLGLSYTGEFDGEPQEFPDLEGTRKVEDMMMSYWANFAKSGDPNGEGLQEWPQVRDNEAFLVISDEPHVGHMYEPDRMSFWSITLPSLAFPSEQGREEL